MGGALLNRRGLLLLLGNELLLLRLLLLERGLLVGQLLLGGAHGVDRVAVTRGDLVGVEQVGEELTEIGGPEHHAEQGRVASLVGGAQARGEGLLILLELRLLVGDLLLGLGDLILHGGEVGLDLLELVARHLGLLGVIEELGIGLVHALLQLGTRGIRLRGHGERRQRYGSGKAKCKNGVGAFELHCVNLLITSISGISVSCHTISSLRAVLGTFPPAAL